MRKRVPHSPRMGLSGKEWGLRSSSLRTVNYEPDSLRSCWACCVAFLDSALEFACGSKVWMALPRPILVVLVQAEVAPTAVFPVISHIRAAKPPGIFRFLLT